MRCTVLLIMGMSVMAPHTRSLKLIVSGAEGYKEQTFLFLSSGQK